MIPFKKSEIISDKIKSLKLGLLQADNIRVAPGDALFESELEKLEKELKSKFNNRAPSENRIVSATRRMYRQVGWEPTKYRPSSEALVRRIIQGKGLYRINNLVDYGNLVSARFHIPMGLYDLDKITGNIWIDIGRENESYEGISRDQITATGKIILRDDLGVFGNPTADSKRTSILGGTRKILAVFFISADIGQDYAWQTLNSLKHFYSLFTETDIKTDIITL